MQGARDALQRAEVFAEALQSRINGLTADFTARDDPAQRSAVGVDRQKALAELDRAKNEIVQQTKAIADIQEEARKAGVPPGWLR
jgi:nucleotide-binding universal stress UspA family protein